MGSKSCVCGEVLTQRVTLAASVRREMLPKWNKVNSAKGLDEQAGPLPFGPSDVENWKLHARFR